MMRISIMAVGIPHSTVVLHNNSGWSGDRHAYRAAVEGHACRNAVEGQACRNAVKGQDCIDAVEVQACGDAVEGQDCRDAVEGQDCIDAVEGQACRDAVEGKSSRRNTGRSVKLSAHLYPLPMLQCVDPYLHCICSVVYG